MAYNEDLEIEKFKLYRNITYLVVGVSMLILLFIVYNTELDLTTLLSLDMATVISLVVAFFAIILSAMFYFKSVETSNNFYNEVHLFIRDTSEKIGRMEERFGKDLEYIGKVQAEMNGTLNEKSKNLMDEKQSLTELKDMIDKTENPDEKKKLEEDLKLKQLKLEDLKEEIQELKIITSAMTATQNILADTIRSKHIPVISTGFSVSTMTVKKYGLHIPLISPGKQNKKEIVQIIHNLLLNAPVKKISYAYKNLNPNYVKFFFESYIDPDDLLYLIRERFKTSTIENKIDISKVDLEHYT